jgi:hypothetical protein
MRNHWLFSLYVLPGSAVDVGTVDKVKEDLRVWRFWRDFFVGDAGTVSRASLRTPARGGGKTPRRSPSSPACASSWPSSTPWFEQKSTGMKRFLVLDSISRSIQ